MDDLKRKLLGNTLVKIKNFANSIVKKTGDYFNPESNGGNNFWGRTDVQNQANSNSGKFIQGAADTFTNRIIKPYGQLLGEAGYQGGRFVFDPTFRKLVLKGPETLTQDELQVQSQPKTKFLKPEQIKDRKEITKTAVAATSKAELATLGLSNPINALTTAGISGLLGFTISKLTGSENPYYDAGAAVGYSPVYAGINKLTAVPQANFTEAIIGKGQPLVTKMLTKGTIDAAANFLTDEIFTPLTESRSPTGQERIISAGTGFVGGAASEGLDSAFKNVKLKVNTLLDKWFPDKDTEFKRSVVGRFVRDELGRFTGIDEPKYLSDPTIPSREIRSTEGVDISSAKTGDTIRFDQRTGKKFQAAGTLTEVQKRELRTALNLPEDGNYNPPIGLSVKQLTKEEHIKMYGDINPQTKLKGELYDIVNGEYLNLQHSLNIDKELIKNLPKDITLKNAIEELDKTGINFVGNDAAAEVAQILKDKGYNYTPEFSQTNDTTPKVVYGSENDPAMKLHVQDIDKILEDTKTTGVKKGTIKKLEDRIDELLGTGGLATGNWKQDYYYRQKHIEEVKAIAPPEVVAEVEKIQNALEDIRLIKTYADGAKAIIPEMAIKAVKKATKTLDNLKLDKNSFVIGRDELGRQTSVSYIPPINSAGKIAKERVKAMELTAKNDYKEWQSQVIKQENLRTSKQLTGDISKTMGENTRSSTADITGLKDISEVSAGWKDIYRNFKSVFGKRYSEAKALILDPFDKAKGNFVDMQEKWIHNLDTYIVKGLGIKKGSVESRLVQEYGEGQISGSDLVKRTKSQAEADKIIAADKWFRQSYNQLLDEVNKARAVIYPNNPEKQIPKRADYYRHFRELAEGFKGLLNIFDTPSGISASLSGISEFTGPKSKWLSMAQKRVGIKTEYDAVGGFLDYIKSAAYAKTIDPQIDRFRSLADELAAATEDGDNKGQLNNFIEYLRDFSNDLSGKTNPLDRTFQKWIPGGRKTFRVINWLNSRIKANTILGNLSSTVAQIFNVPQGIASAGPVNSVKGLGRTFADIFRKGGPMNDSSFIKERYFNGYDKFDTGLLDNTKRFAAWMTGVLDEVGTKYIWNSHYEKALASGMENPVKFADDLTREMVAGRGVGEVPLAQKSKVTQFFAPFQLEVANLWWVMKDFVDQKQFGKLATLFAANYVFNKAAEKIRGSGVVFDPIQAMSDAFSTYQQEPNKKMGVIKAGGRLAGEVLSNVPYGQTVAAMYPENGATIGNTKIPTRKELFGKDDPTRYGGGVLVAKGLQDPLYKVLPSFGGAQIEKTIKGVKTYLKGYSENSKGQVQFPVEQTPTNALKSIAFGQYSTPEAVKYLNSGGQPLGDKQTAMFKQSDQKDKLKVYTDILSSREQKKLEDEARTKVEKLGQTQETANKIFYMEDGEVRSVLKNRQITIKPLTGSKELDSKIISSYKSDLTAKENDIVKLWELGKLSQDEAIKQLQMIKKLKNKIAKPKKAKVIKYKVPKLNKIKASSTKIPKSRLAKLSSKKTKRTTAKLSVPRIWT